KTTECGPAGNRGEDRNDRPYLCSERTLRSIGGAMRAWQIATLLAVGIVLVLASIVLRVRSSGKYEVRTGDLALLVVPLLLVALATGKIKGLDAFGVKADLSELWAEAAKAKIQPHVAQARPVSVQDVVQASE